MKFSLIFLLFCLASPCTIAQKSLRTKVPYIDLAINLNLTGATLRFTTPNTCTTANNVSAETALTYTSSKSLAPYYVEVVTWYRFAESASLPALVPLNAQGSFSQEASQLQPNQILNELCIIMTSSVVQLDAVFYVFLYRKGPDGRKVGEPLHISNASTQTKLTNPNYVKPNPVIALSNYETTGVRVNSCKHNSGETGSMFQHKFTITYAGIGDFEASKRYVTELVNEYRYSDETQFRRYEMVAPALPNGSYPFGPSDDVCATFGNASFLDCRFYVRLYANDGRGNKTGPVLATSNVITYQLNKPAGGARLPVTVAGTATSQATTLAQYFRQVPQSIPGGAITSR